MYATCDSFVVRWTKQPSVCLTAERARNNNHNNKMPTIYIGYDEKEKTYFDVLKYSIEKYSSEPINIVPLKHKLAKGIKRGRQDTCKE